jgi:2'-5' RNA ligase
MKLRLEFKPAVYGGFFCCKKRRFELTNATHYPIFKLNQQLVDQYSLAIMPSAEISQQLAEMKQIYKSAIGKSYGSANAEAHISLDGFEADEENYPFVLAEYQRVISGLAPFEISFSDFADFDRANFSAFYVRLTEESCEAIRERTGVVMRTFDKKLKKQYVRKWADESKKPHMSVGRRLSREWIALAHSIFNSYEASFTCDSFVIRKFNEKRRQYEVIDILPLLGDNATALQLDLFQP